MTHPLEKKIGRLRRRLRLLAAARAAAWMIAAAVGGVVLLGMIDYWVRFRDGGMRVICTLAFLALMAWVCHRFCYRKFFGGQARRLLSSLSLARRVEHCFPQLGGSLASSIEFLQQPENDLRAGSPVLRRAVIAATAAESEGMIFTRAADVRPARQAVIAAAAMCLLAAVIALADPLWLQVAVARLAYPLGDVAWPQKNHLELVERVERVAAGGTFEVEAKDAFDARLPADAKIYYRLYEADGGAREQVEPMRHLGRVLQARRENVTAPFAYRIAGGDDRSMDWIEVEVVAPPAVQSLAVRLTPPPYAGLPAATIDESQTTGFRALAGSRVAVQATVNMPLKSAAMHLDDARRIPGRVSADGMMFVVPAGEKDEPGFAVEQSCSFAFEMIDRQGLSGGGDLHWDIRVVEDRPPAVTIENPRETVYAAPQATLPLAVLAKDDLAVHRVELVVQLEKTTGDNVLAQKDAPEQKIVLFEGLPQAADANQLPSGEKTVHAGPEGESRSVAFPLELATLELGGRRPQPGWTLVFHAEAEDYKPLAGRSDARRLVIVTPDEMLERIAARQQSILAALVKVLELQRESGRQVTELAILLEENKSFSTAEIDRLRRAELAQREVFRLLTAADEGVGARIRLLVGALENNRLDNPEVRRRLEEMLAEIDRLSAKNLAVIAAEMTAAIKTARIGDAETDDGAAAKSGEAATALLASLRTVENNQAEVVESLQRMVDSLSEWDDYRRFHLEVGRLMRKQEDILQISTDLGGRTLGKALADLSPQEAAELRIAAGDQAEASRHFDRIIHDMTRMVEKLDRHDPSAADKLREALQCATRRAIAPHMRSAGDNLGQNRIAQATAEQDRIVEELQELLDILAERRQNALARLVERLRKNEPEAAEQEKPAAEKMDELDQNLADLERRQGEALKETVRLDSLRAHGGELEGEHKKALGSLAEQQATLSKDAAAVTEKTDLHSIFRLALSGAVDKMEEAARRLVGGETSRQVQVVQRQAQERLARMISALKSAKDEQEKANAGGGDAGAPGGKGGERQGQDLKLLAQLKLCKMLQEEIQRRTLELQQKYGGDGRPPQQLDDEGRQAYAELAAEQRRLAEMMLKLLPAQRK